MNRYQYKELREKALETRADADINALADWMQEYGNNYWNGEVFDIDDGYLLRPIHGEPDEYEDVEIVSWEIL